MKTMLSAILLMICCLYSGVNWARSNFGFYFGVPLYPYPYYRDPFYLDPFYSPYYPPTVITVPATPPVYIQQPTTPQQYPPSYWYYCRPLEGYYPYIKECPSGWQQVVPMPPSPR